jgi:TonB family protein
MSRALLLSNLVALALQIGLLVAAGAALARACRLDAPRVLLAYWRTLLLVCLILPFCQPWTAAAPAPLVAAVAGEPIAGDLLAGTVAPSSDTRSVFRLTGDIVLGVLAAGIAARVLWLALGVFGLWRLRRAARRLDPLPDSLLHAQERTGTKAAMYVSEQVAGPMTYGLFRPVVVFPPTLSAMPVEVQTAITCHELLHVRRRDWVSEVLEEAVRCALWFHPAIWWLIGRIQLAREEVVDQAAIELTESKERYVESLLAVALAGSPVTYTPTSAFLRRRLLQRRIARILQESTMTTQRLIASLTVSAAALALTGLFAVRSFPLEAQGRKSADTGAPVQLLSGGEHLLHGALPEYPDRAVGQKIEGDVVVDMTLDDRGEVSDARVLSGPEELRRAALEAVLQWHYSQASLSSTGTQATLRFKLPPAGGTDLSALVPKERRLLREKFESESQMAEHRLAEIARALEDPSTIADQRAELEAKQVEAKKMLQKFRGPEREIEVKPEPLVGAIETDVLKRKIAELEGGVAEDAVMPARLAAVRTERVSESMAREVLAHSSLAIGDPISKESIERLREAAHAVDEHVRVEVEKTREGLVVTLLAR